MDLIPECCCMDKMQPVSELRGSKIRYDFYTFTPRYSRQGCSACSKNNTHEEINTLDDMLFLIAEL